MEVSNHDGECIETSTTLSIPTFVKYKGKKTSINLNGYRNWHYRVSNNYKVEYKSQVHDSIKDLVFPEKIKIEYTYFAPDLRKRDLMNHTSIVDKFFQDALVEYGCIKSDDTGTVVGVNSLYGGLDRENSRIDVKITSIPN